MMYDICVELLARSWRNRSLALCSELLASWIAFSLGFGAAGSPKRVLLSKARASYCKLIEVLVQRWINCIVPSSSHSGARSCYVARVFEVCVHIVLWS